jgi:DNA-binding HxlR family transcriptional regulator
MKKRKFNCPAEMTLSLIGGKWKAILIYNLRKEPRRFGELKRRSPGITSTALANQLKELEDSGLITRTVLDGGPVPAVEYALTAKGESFKPILYSLIRWGIAHQREYAIGDFGMAVFQK